MAGDTSVTIIGNLTADPELRFTPAGDAVANFTVASTPRSFDRRTNEWKDGEALFLRCSLWREAAENIAESLPRGARVIVSGRLRQRTYQTRDGDKRTVVELDVDEVGPSLRYATATVTRTNRRTGTDSGFGRPTTSPAAGAPIAHGSNTDPWNTQAAHADTDDADPWAVPATTGAGASGFSGEPPF
ncbi:single-stranded DNA-binding protein [Nocardia thailandica]